MTSQAPIVRILEFFQLPHTDADGKVIYRDWVRFAPFHAPQSTVNEELVARLKPQDSYRNDDEGLKAVAMRARWSVIGPAYEAWKKGEALPENGTPLAAWPGVTKEQVKGLRIHGIATVEEAAALTDSQINKIALPNVRDIREQAKRFLDSLDTTKAAEQLRRRDEEIDALKRQMAELMASRKEAVSDGEDEGAPKRRGRPPKAAGGVMTVAEALEANEAA